MKGFINLKWKLCGPCNHMPKFELLYLLDGPGSSSRLSPNVTLLEVDAGDPVPPISCSADCVPACDFSWKQTYRNTERTRSGHLLNLGNATSAVVGIHTCKASNYISGKQYSGSVTFELRVKCECCGIISWHKFSNNFLHFMDAI